MFQLFSICHRAKTACFKGFFPLIVFFFNIFSDYHCDFGIQSQQERLIIILFYVYSSKKQQHIPVNRVYIYISLNTRHASLIKQSGVVCKMLCSEEKNK